MQLLTNSIHSLKELDNEMQQLKAEAPAELKKNKGQLQSLIFEGNLYQRDIQQHLKTEELGTGHETNEELMHGDVSPYLHIRAHYEDH